MHYTKTPTQECARKKKRKKKRTVKELVSTKTVKGNRAVEKHKNGHKGLTFES